MKTTIDYYEKQNYGTPALYITGQYKAAIADLTGRRTITLRDMQALNRLGFTFNRVAAPSAFPTLIPA